MNTPLKKNLSEKTLQKKHNKFNKKRTKGRKKTTWAGIKKSSGFSA